MAHVVGRRRDRLRVNLKRTQDQRHAIINHALGCVLCTRLYTLSSLKALALQHGGDLVRLVTDHIDALGAEPRYEPWVDDEIRRRERRCAACSKMHAIIDPEIHAYQREMDNSLDTSDRHHTRQRFPRWCKYRLRGSSKEIPVRVLQIHESIPAELARRYATGGGNATPSDYTTENAKSWVARYQLEILVQLPGVLRQTHFANDWQTPHRSLARLIADYADPVFYQLSVALLLPDEGPQGGYKMHFALLDETLVLEIVSGWSWATAHLLLKHVPFPIAADFCRPLGFQTLKASLANDRPH